jgi:hypothetical protein
MGRREIEEVLESNPGKWFTYEELSKLTHRNRPNISLVCRKLAGFSLIMDTSKDLTNGKKNVIIVKWKGD